MHVAYEQLLDNIRMC